MFHVMYGEVLISDVTIQNGAPPVGVGDNSGGGIDNGDNLSGAALTVMNVTVRDNVVEGSGGGINACGVNGTGSTRLINVSIIDNVATGTSGRGGGIYSCTPITLEVSGSVISGNTAVLYGGGMQVVEGLLDLSDSIVSANEARYGGGISGSGTILRSTITGNRAARGGGIGSGDLTVAQSTVSHNEAVLVGAIVAEGGGIYNLGTLSMTDSVVHSNSSVDEGAGIWTVGIATLRNTTVSGNWAEDTGGGLMCSGGTLDLNNVTVANNSAYSGGGLMNASIVNPGNTIISDNGETGGGGPDCAGTVNSQGYNLIEQVDGCTVVGDPTGNVIGQDPGLEPLADNGGLTVTHALGFSSAAVDAGNPAAPGSGGGACEGNDQRGIVRPVSTACDMGAYEYACGNGEVDFGEVCDDGGESEICDDDCTGVECGDGTLNETAGEACDDGNTASGDCCSAACQFEASGSPCGLCQVCNGLGGCAVGPQEPCREPVVPLKAMLLFKDKEDDARDKLIWKWIKGEKTEGGDFGDPVTTDDYTLCVYEASGLSPSLLLSAAAPAGGQCAGRDCWRALGTRGFKYKDKEGTPEGLDKILLKSGDVGKAKIIVKGKGTNLALPSPLDVELPVTVQLQSGNGGCWEADYFSVGVKKSEPGFFKAKAGSPSDAFQEIASELLD